MGDILCDTDGALARPSVIDGYFDRPAPSFKMLTDDVRSQTASAPIQERRPDVRLGQQRTDRLRRVQRLAKLMDSSLSVPGLPIKFGLDSLLGLIPGVGDVVTATIGGWVIREAYRAGAPKRLMAQMLANVTVDTAIGTIPVVGDMFDIYWKSNVRNARLLARHLEVSESKTPLHSTDTR